MEKPHYRAIFLVFASENSGIYSKLKVLHEKFIYTNSNIKVFYVYAGKVSFIPKEHDLVYGDLKEDLIQPHPAKKTVRAMEYIYSNYSFDYLVRTNLSTFWLFDKFLKRLDKLPKVELISGRLGYIKPDFIVGSDMVISSSLVDKLLNSRESVFIPYQGKYIPEDRILSEFFTNKCKAKMIPADGAVHVLEHLKDVSNIELIKAPHDGIDHFRVKNLADRDNIDPAVFNILYDLYYKDINK